MSLTMEDCIKLKAAGYSEHDIAQIAKVPTPTIVGLARYGKQPQFPIGGVNVEELLKARKPKEEPKTEPQPIAPIGQPQENPERRGPGRPPKNEEK